MFSLIWAFQSTAFGGWSDFPTCFPMTVAIRDGIIAQSRLAGDGPVFVEEHSACESRAIAPLPIVVPEDLSGYEALRFVVEAYPALVPDAPRYEMVARAGGWLIAPVADRRIVDLTVDVDPTRCSTVALAERCVLDEAYVQAGVSFGHRWYEDPRDVLPSRVKLKQVPLLEALRATYAQHETAAVGFAMELERSPKPGRYIGHYWLLNEPVLKTER